MNFIEIQSWPEVPQIGFFTSLFSSAFNLPDFDIEDLEEALLYDSSENSSINGSTVQEFSPRLVPDLIVALLKGCKLLEKSWPNITASSYQMFLRRIFRHKCEEYNIENPFNTDVDFHSLSLRTKVIILNYLCEFRLDSADVETITNKLEADSLRIQPLGFDSNDSTYWYFFGTRLYREDFQKISNSKKKGERIWQVICFSEEDWHNLAKKFKYSKSQKEVTLYKCLTEDFLPKIPDIFKAKEAERRRRLFQRRTSSRVKALDRHKNHQSLSYDAEPHLGISDEEKLSFEGKFLVKKNKEKAAKLEIQRRIQHQRALRAQRRSSSSTSSKSSVNFNTNKSSSSSNEDSEDNDDIDSLKNNSLSFNNNKENILVKKKSLNKFERVAERVDQNFITKMPPVTTKLPGRQTNNSLSSVTGNIVIQATTPNTISTNNSTAITSAAVASTSTSSASSSSQQQPPQPPRKKNNNAKSELPKKAPLVSRFMETDEVVQIGMHKVLQQVKNHDDAWPFMDPVEEDIAPRYYSIIKRPMDLMKMEEKLDSGEYLTFAEFRTDFKLIVNNCRLYNGQNNEYTQMVNNIQIAFDRATKKYFDQNSSDEEQVLLEYPPIIEPVNKLKPSTTAIKVQKSDDKKSKHNNSININNNKKSVRSDSSSQEDNNNDDNEDDDEEKEITVVEKSNKKIKKKDEKKSGGAVVKEKEKNTLRGKRKREKDDSENASKSKKSKKSADHEDIKDNEIVINASNKKIETKKSKKIKEKEIVLTELKSNKKSKSKKIVESSPSPSKIIKQKQSKPNKKSSPVKSNKSEKEKLKNNHNNKYFDSSDMSSDNESIRDLINEDFKNDDDEGDDKEVNEDHKKDNKNNNKKQKPIKDTKKSAKSLKKHKKSAKNEEPHHKANKSLEDAFSMSGSERSKSPMIPSIVDDFDSSMERKELSEIKDKYDLIKERRNKHLQADKSVKSAKESSTTSSSNNKKEKSSHKEKHVKDKKKDEKLSVFDELLAEKHSENYKQHFGNNEKSKTEIIQDEPTTKPSKKHSKKDARKVPTEIKQVVNEVVKQKGSKKQNKASLDVLDMETEQTLKDINKWLEHTPRFEYNSASNSPSRYVIEDIDMHSKIDDNDFRKPIPLLPSSPSTSNKVFHSPTQKDDKILKDTNNKGVQGPSSTASATNAAIANKKALKESKRKNLKDKLQPAPKKKELQRTIDRLQPGKTKGNLLSNIQNINKPEELFPLGNREKVKEIKSSLTVEPDLSGPQLNLGKVLDTSTFNLYDPKQEKECFSDTEPCERKSLSDSSIKGEDLFEKVENIESGSPNEKDALKIGDVKVPTECNNSASDSSSSTKPNLNAWFKAFGMPKKPKSIEEPVKKLIENEAKLESSYTSNRQRKLSTGSSMSERSSVEDSPHVSLEERGAPAPFPSPIGASPMSASPMSASPKPEENSIQKTNYPINPINSSTRVGFYQDTTSTKSSPDKSCSPREMLSPYHGHFSQQPNAYANPTNASNSDAYSNFYNPEATNKQRQTSYSKQTNSPTPYYDQYKQPMSQESDFNNSMSPNTNPNSPYHSQQSSPYQQQPNSPYQQSSNGSGTNITNSANMISTRSPNYSQPNSPYQQNNQAAVSPFNQQQAPQVVTQQLPTTTPQTNQQPNFNNQHYNSLFNQPQQPEITQFSPNPQQQQSDSKMPPNPTYNMQQQQQKPPIASAMYNNNQLQQAPVIAPTKATIPNAANVMSNMQQQPMMYPESLYVDQNKNRNYGVNKKPELQQPSIAAPIAPLNEVPRFNAAEQKIDENPKYLDLSKQTNRQHPQYQQAPVATAYSKPEYDKNSSYEMIARSMQKNASYAGAMENCTIPNEISYDAVQKNVPTYGVNSAVSSGPTESSIKDLTKSSSLSNLMQNPPASNLIYQAHQTAKASHPSSMDYKSSPLFNTPSASSMMELTAFMRDFRQPDDRFSSFPNPSSGFYDKPITPSHMFGKNISSSASTLQQMFSNPMTTMAYGREQQEYQNRLNAFQAANNTPTPAPVSQMPAENKPKKSKKSKKNASPEILPPTASSQHPSMSQHQMPTNQQQSHQAQFAMHQQSFQSFAGLKIPSAGSSSSADAMKSVVPGSAFNYGPSPLGLYGENSPYLDEFRGAQGSYYPPALRSAESTDKTTPNPPQAHPAAPSSPYHHLLPSHHPPRSYPFMNSIDPATLQQQYRMMFNQTYQAGYHLGMHNQPPWHM